VIAAGVAPPLLQPDSITRPPQRLLHAPCGLAGGPRSACCILDPPVVDPAQGGSEAVHFHG
jgi:hypothetical protein